MLNVYNALSGFEEIKLPKTSTMDDSQRVPLSFCLLNLGTFVA